MPDSGIHLQARDANLSCPYCRGALIGGGLVWSCPGCETLHHRECAVENEGCTVLGCKEPFDKEKAIVFVAAPPANDRLIAVVALVAGLLLTAIVGYATYTRVVADRRPPTRTAPRTPTRATPRPAPAPLPAGTFPRARLSGPDGEVTLPLGRPAIVNVWLENCGDCMPAFDTWTKLAETSVRLPVVNVAYGRASADWAAKHGVRQSLVFDEGGASVVKPLGIGTFTTYVLDANGKILWVGNPHQETFAAQLDEVITRIERDTR